MPEVKPLTPLAIEDDAPAPPLAPLMPAPPAPPIEFGGVAVTVPVPRPLARLDAVALVVSATPPAPPL